MVIFLLLLRERRTIDETERHRTVARLKNLANVKRREREEGEERERRDKERGGRKDRSGKEKDIRTLPPDRKSVV